jgi:hypothetical protein
VILDSKGRTLKRAIGFVSGYELAGKPQAIGPLYVVGFEVPLEKDEELEKDE